MRDIKYGALAPLADWQMARHTAQAAEQAGFDFVVHGDTVNLWIPRGLWTPELSPLANLVDVDQAMDVWLMMGDIATHTERVHQGPTVCDAIRRNPTNYAQLLLTLDHMSQGRCFLGLATGESRHFHAYGIPRDRPFTHLEESVKIIKMLIENHEPIRYEGPIWSLDRAIMAVRPYNEDSPPPVLIAGSGPRALRIAGEYGDGWIALTPIGGDAEKVAECVNTVKQHAEAAGRDPDKLRFHLTAMCLIGEDEEQIDRMVNHPLLRWDATCLMLNGKDWEKWGLGEHPIRPDYNYARDLTSMWWKTEDAWKVIEATPPQVVRNTRHVGTPKEVAGELQAFIQAGMTWVNPINWAMFVADPAAAQGRDLVADTCAELRKLNGQPAVEPALAL